VLQDYTLHRDESLISTDSGLVYRSCLRNEAEFLLMELPVLYKGAQCDPD